MGTIPFSQCSQSSRRFSFYFDRVAVGDRDPAVLTYDIIPTAVIGMGVVPLQKALPFSVEDQLDLVGSREEVDGSDLADTAGGPGPVEYDAAGREGRPRLRPVQVVGVLGETGEFYDAMSCARCSAAPPEVAPPAPDELAGHVRVRILRGEHLVRRRAAVRCVQLVRSHLK